MDEFFFTENFYEIIKRDKYFQNYFSVKYCLKTISNHIIKYDFIMTIDEIYKKPIDLFNNIKIYRTDITSITMNINKNNIYYTSFIKI
jgi:hypothetical protein